MQIKNNNKIISFIFFSFFLILNSVYAEEFNITAKEILLDKDNEILTGKGSVQAIDSDGNIIIAEKIIYKKSEEFLIAEGNVKITDKMGNILLSDKATYDKPNELIKTLERTELILKKGYTLESKNIYYSTDKKTLNSNETRCAIRFSEYEDIKTINNLKKKINWVWVDNFSKFPLNKSISNSLKKKNIKICIVSPEIVKKTSIQNLKKLKNSIQKKNIHIDAVCTKNPEIWNK